jgi:hypothetical protein
LGYDKIVELLINRGVDINIKDKWDQTSLHIGLLKIILKLMKIINETNILKQHIMKMLK